MSIEKALKAKNSGVFIENLQAAFLQQSPRDILNAIDIAPPLKWSAEMEINKLGLMAWCDENCADGLMGRVLSCISSQEYRSAAIGCLYLFGAGQSAAGIELAEKAFESIETSSDYEFNATSVCEVLIPFAIDWKGAPSGKFYVRIDGNYLGSTILSVADDLRASGLLYKESYILDFSTGLCRAGMREQSSALVKEFIKQITEYSDIQSLIYNFTTTTEGMPAVNRSTENSPIAWVAPDLLTICLDKAKSCSGRSDKDALAELQKYVVELTSQ